MSAYTTVPLFAIRHPMDPKWKPKTPCLVWTWSSTSAELEWSERYLDHLAVTEKPWSEIEAAA